MKFIINVVPLLFILWNIYLKFSFAKNEEEDSGTEKPSAIVENIFWKDFLKSYAFYDKYNEIKSESNLTILGYVTPWNNHGYDIAKEFGPKFNLISPVWLQIKHDTPGFKVHGLHDVDKNWISTLKTRNNNMKIVPRILFDGWTDLEYRETFKKKNMQDLCINTIIKMLSDYNFDGTVIELWSQHSGTSEQELISFVKLMGKHLKAANKLFIFVIPPFYYNGGFTGRFSREHFDQLYGDVDYFSLMTYDYSHPHSPGPNSPIDWIRKCVVVLVPENLAADERMRKRAKLLVGSNFYGNMYQPSLRTGGTVLGSDFVKVVKKHHPKFYWDKESAEHYAYFTDSRNIENRVYFPTMLSIARRISLLQEMGTGLSIWEIGQGLDSFYTLL